MDSRTVHGNQFFSTKKTSGFVTKTWCSLMIQTQQLTTTWYLKHKSTTVYKKYSTSKKNRTNYATTSMFHWLFQLDDSKSLHEKWLEITKHPLKNGCFGYQAWYFRSTGIVVSSTILVFKELHPWQTRGCQNASSVHHRMKGRSPVSQSVNFLHGNLRYPPQSAPPPNK